MGKLVGIICTSVSLITPAGRSGGASTGQIYRRRHILVYLESRKIEIISNYYIQGGPKNRTIFKSV